MSEMDDRPTPEADELPLLVKPELQPGERLLWAARAQRKLPGEAIKVIGPSIFTFTSLALCFLAFYASFGPTRPQLLSIEPVLLSIGAITMFTGLISGVLTVYCVADQWLTRGRFVAKLYALTDRRAIIWIPQKPSNAIEVHSFARGTIKDIHRLEYPDGSGSVRFGPILDGYHNSPMGFEGVADVRFVEDLSRRTLIDPGPSSPA